MYSDEAEKSPECRLVSNFPKMCFLIKLHKSFWKDCKKTNNFYGRSYIQINHIFGMSSDAIQITTSTIFYTVSGYKPYALGVACIVFCYEYLTSC